MLNMIKLSWYKIFFRVLIGVSLLVSSLYAEGPVEVYGEMKVKGQYFVGSKEPYTNSLVQVKGISFFWDTFGGEGYWNAATVDDMVDNYHAEVLRVAVTTSSNGKRASLANATAVIDQCIKRGIYIIVDYHSHFAWNEIAEAKEFFTAVVNKYGDKDNVIFEIFNEPDTEVPHEWQPIKEYADELVKHIRDLGSDNLIIVGTPSFCQVFGEIRTNQVEDPDNNLAYVMHFYSYSHFVGDEWTGRNFTRALKQGLPFFVSEWGTSHFNGGRGEHTGTYDGESADEWHALLDEYGFSSAMWSIFSDQQSSAMWGNSGDAERYVKKLLLAQKAKADWRNGTTTALPEILNAIIDDIVLVLPENSATLSGTPVGGVAPYKYRWGKSSSVKGEILEMAAETTTVEGLVEGVHDFYLKITDARNVNVKIPFIITVTDGADIDVSSAEKENPSSEESDDSVESGESKSSNDKADESSDRKESTASEDFDSSDSGQPMGNPDKDADTSPLFESHDIENSVSLIYRSNQSMPLSVPISEAGVYKLRIYDVLGNHLLSMGTQRLSVGKYDVPLLMELSEGVYVVKMQKR